MLREVLIIKDVIAVGGPDILLLVMCVLLAGYLFYALILIPFTAETRMI